LKVEDTRLKGFSWKEDEKPARNDVVRPVPTAPLTP
jgi:hypothetical protein